MKSSKLFERLPRKDDNDEDPLAVQHLYLDEESRLLAVAAAHHIILFTFSKKESTRDVTVSVLLLLRLRSLKLFPTSLTTFPPVALWHDRCTVPWLLTGSNTPDSGIPWIYCLVLVFCHRCRAVHVCVPSCIIVSLAVHAHHCISFLPLYLKELNVYVWTREGNFTHRLIFCSPDRFANPCPQIINIL